MVEIAPRTRKKRDPLTVWMIVAVSTTILALPVLLAVTILLERAFDVLLDFASFGFWVTIIGAIPAASLLSIWLVRAPRPSRAVAWAGLLGALAGAAPISAVLFFRFQFSGCAGFNFFGVPWPEPWQTMAQVMTIGVCIGAVALIVKGLSTPSIRFSAIAMLVWLLAAAFPSMLLFFISIYGDPGPGCLVP